MNSGNVAITRFDLDWVCITQRAAKNDTDNADLWLESVRAMRNLIAAFNSAAIDEAHAAHAQFLIERLAEYATFNADAASMAGAAVADVTEQYKDQLMHIAAGEYDPVLRFLV